MGVLGCPEEGGTDCLGVTPRLAPPASYQTFVFLLFLVVGWACLREDGCRGPSSAVVRLLRVGLWSLGSHGGSLTPLSPHGEGGRVAGQGQREGDAVPAVPGSSESTRSYRRISGVGGKVGSAVSPQSPGGPEDPALSKVPPVPMPRRFAPVGATFWGGGWCLRGVVMGFGVVSPSASPSVPVPLILGWWTGGIRGVTSLHPSSGGCLSLPCPRLCRPRGGRSG